jgi:hypothetical protein
MEKVKEKHLKHFCSFYTSFEFIVVFFNQLMKKSKKEKKKKRFHLYQNSLVKR